jgi:ribosomal protein L44E
MRLSEMKTQCRKCGKELIADSKDPDFVTFYCMKCGIYTNKPVEDFKDKPEETAACPMPATEQQPK